MAQDFHNKIAQLCINAFNNIPKTGKPNTKEWTILSCILKEDISKDHMEVVSLGTGTKCIGKNKMSTNGDILNDSHAEIICRRAFLRYVYEELISTNNEIFYFDNQIVKYCLKEGIRFHFFTSHIPCGDAAIFSKQDSSEFGKPMFLKRALDVSDDDCTTFNPKQPKFDTSGKSQKDIFRTGAKCLPHSTKQDPLQDGTDYHIVDVVRTKPGRGDPTLSASCSDKLAKWCHLGIQGALLSILLINPIYLSSFTIAAETPFDRNALYRCLFARLNSVSLKSPYKSTKLEIGQALSTFEHSKNDSKQPSASSIIWYKNDPCSLEVAVEGKKQGVTKKNQNTKKGRLKICKIELFRLFLDITEKKRLHLFEDKNLRDIRYYEAKNKAALYQEMWSMLKNEGFKVWTIKDCALLNFIVD